MELTVQIGFAQLVEVVKKLSPEERAGLQSVLSAVTTQTTPVERKFGTLKGAVTYIADDFDAPLDDFQAYM